MIVLYARISDEQEDEVSMTRQRLRLTEAASRLYPGQRVVLEQDDGKSGFKETRPGWQRVLGHLRKGKVKALLAADLSRLHRNAGHAITFAKDYLVKRGVNLVLLDEKVDLSTAAGTMQFQVICAANEFHRNVTSEKTKRAMRHKAANGDKLGGHAPYGYRAVNGKLVPDEAEQSVLHRIRELAGSGLRSKAIAQVLTDERVPTKTGLYWWQARTVARILKGNYTTVAGVVGA